MRRHGGAWARLLGLVAATAALAAAAANDPSVSQPHACADAVVVAGRLTCGEARAVVLARTCPDLALVPPGSVVDARCHAQPDAGLMRALDVPVDINRADPVALQSLPGIGPALARRIVDARPFASADDLLDVRGIGPVTLRRIAPRVQVVAHPPAVHLGSPRRLKIAAPADEGQ